MLGRELEREEGALGVDGVEPVELVLGDVDCRCLDQFDAGVGDDDVETAEVIDGFGEQSFEVVDATHVGLDGDGLAARSLDRLDGIGCSCLGRTRS